jgi:hypothetical protein
MGTHQVGLQDIVDRSRATRLRLLAPLRYLGIKNREKHFYDLVAPLTIAIFAWCFYLLVTPRIPLFGEAGLLRFTRDLLIMAVPFMVGALAAVSMGAPGPHLDRRPIGVEIHLDGELLTLRQFLCYLLGYLSFLGLATLFAAVAAGLLRDTIVAWTANAALLKYLIHLAGSLTLSVLLSSLSVTVLWALYFLTEIANRTQRDD